MKRLTALLAAAMLVTAGLPAAAAVAGQPSDSGVQPGAQFAGAVGVQGAEVEGEVEERALDRRFAAADSNRSRARVVAEESERASERLDALRERRSALRERHENGSISESEYRARLAGIAAESRALERRLNGTAAAARSLPPEVARERGVNASAIAGLRAEADELDDGEAAEAARSVAGDGVGNGLGGPPEDVGPPRDGNGERDGDDRGNGSDGGPPGDAGPPDDAGPGGNSGNGADDRTNGNGSADGNTSDADDERPDAGGADENANRSGDRGNGTGAGNGSGDAPGENRGNGNGADDRADDDDDGEGTTEDDGSTAADDATLTPTPTQG